MKQKNVILAFDAVITLCTYAVNTAELQPQSADEVIKKAEKAMLSLRGLLSMIPSDKEMKKYRKIVDRAHKQFGNNAHIELRTIQTGIGNVFKVWVAEAHEEAVDITDYNSW